MSDSDSDYELTLSANALAALEEFKREEQQHQEAFQKLYDETDEDFQKKKKRRRDEAFQGRLAAFPVLVQR